MGSLLSDANLDSVATPEAKFLKFYETYRDAILAIVTGKPL